MALDGFSQEARKPVSDGEQICEYNVLISLHPTLYWLPTSHPKTLPSASGLTTASSLRLFEAIGLCRGQSARHRRPLPWLILTSKVQPLHYSEVKCMDVTDRDKKGPDAQQRSRTPSITLSVE